MSTTIAIAIYDTEENDRTKYTQETLLSLYDTVDWTKHRLWLIDNNSCIATKKLISGAVKSMPNCESITLPENIGTARAINLAMARRSPGDVLIKMDNDVVVHESGWVEKMEEVFRLDPTIGICGLKRTDVWQNPYHADPKYRTTMESLSDSVEIEICEDIMGTCTAFNPLLMKSINYMNQLSVYGFDDVLYSVRSVAAGFRNCFLPSISITHLDDGKSDYSEWKRRHAGENISEIGIMCDMYKSGKISPYYGGDFNA